MKFDLIKILGSAGALFRLIYTYILSTKKGTLDRTLFSYTGFYSVMLAAAVFVFIRYSSVNKLADLHPKLAGILKSLAGCSFGIYLMHMIIFRKIIMKYITIYTWPFRLIAPFIIYAIGLVITYILKKIPVINKLVP